MLPTTVILLLLSLLNLAFSSSLLSPRQASATQQYYLRTSIVDATNDTGTPKGHLYLTSYHTGAGLSDAVLTSNISNALPGYLNSTLNPDSGETTWITNLTAIVAGGSAVYWDLCGGFENEASKSILPSPTAQKLSPRLRLAAHNHQHRRIFRQRRLLPFLRRWRSACVGIRCMAWSVTSSLQPPRKTDSSIL